MFQLKHPKIKKSQNVTIVYVVPQICVVTTGMYKVNRSLEDAHGLKIKERGQIKFLPKSLGGQGFQEKLPGGSPYFGFYCIFIIKSFEIRVGGPIYTIPKLPITTSKSEILET